ncbi:CvpA family protein [Corticicoccus populi]|uniref:CvpA family protein n=1 Tax=Corticicoccus populi TaxID=1812821 RepID=A0ABW5WRW2_9STAP
MGILLLVLLIIGLVAGYRRGLVLQSLHLIGTISAVIIAALNYETLSARLDLIMPYPSTAESLANPIFPDIASAEYAYYDMSAFFMIFIVSKIVIQLIVSAFDYFQQVSVFGIVGDILGLVLGIIEMIYVLIVVLYMLALIPADITQNFVIDSSIADFIMDHTFILSDKFIEWLQIES